MRVCRRRKCNDHQKAFRGGRNIQTKGDVTRTLKSQNPANTRLNSFVLISQNIAGSMLKAQSQKYHLKNVFFRLCKFNTKVSTKTIKCMLKMCRKEQFLDFGYDCFGLVVFPPQNGRWVGRCVAGCAPEVIVGEATTNYQA